MRLCGRPWRLTSVATILRPLPRRCLPQWRDWLIRRFSGRYLGGTLFQDRLLGANRERCGFDRPAGASTHDLLAPDRLVGFFRDLVGARGGFPDAFEPNRLGAGLLGSAAVGEVADFLAVAEQDVAAGVGVLGDAEFGGRFRSRFWRSGSLNARLIASSADLAAFGSSPDAGPVFAGAPSPASGLAAARSALLRSSAPRSHAACSASLPPRSPPA